MRSYPQYFCSDQKLVALLITFSKSATKTKKRAITRDYDDRNIPDVFDVVYDVCCRDECSIAACHRCWFYMQMQMRSLSIWWHFLSLKVPPKP